MTIGQDIIDVVRQRTHMEHNQFVTDTELLGYTNASLAELDDLLIATYEDYKVSQHTFTLAVPIPPDDARVALPADFLKGHGVDRQINGVWMTLQPFQNPNRNMYSFPIINYLYGYMDVFYEIIDGYVQIIPAQNSGATYRLHYVPVFTPLASVSSTLPTYMSNQSWTEYAVVDVSIKVLEKQNLDPSTFMAQKMGLQTRIINAAKPRDVSGVKVIQNTRYRRDFMGPNRRF